MTKRISNNIRIYPIYCIFGWDLLFYYSISTLFITTVKGVDISHVVLIDSIAALGAFVFQIPVRIIASKLTNKKNILIGVLSWIIGGLIILMAPNEKYIILGRLFYSLGSAFKAPAEISILQEPLTKLRRSNWYTIIFGKGLSSYLYVNAIGGVLAGFLFNINGYLPMVLTTICPLIAFAAALNFNENNEELSRKLTIRGSIDELKKGIKHIGNSTRLKTLLLYTLTYFSIVGITGSYAGIYLKEAEINPALFSFIFAALSLVQAIFSKLEYKIEKKLKTKTLTVFSLTHIFSFILVGIVGMFTKNITLVVLLFIVQYALSIMDRVARSKYITNFTTSGVRESILSINSMVEYFTRFLGLLLASFLLKKLDISTSYIVLGLVYLVINIKVLDIMKTRLGKKPEEYSMKERLYDPFKEKSENM